ncbi:MAG: chorismate-binding protein [Ginsengibacter sp.]
MIRSVQYNQASKYISVMAGSAITHHSVPEKEYEECILKVSAMKEALS